MAGFCEGGNEPPDSLKARRPRRRWEDNIKIDLREVGYDDREWINLAQDSDQWRAYVRAAMNLEPPGFLKAKINSLNSKQAVEFSQFRSEKSGNQMSDHARHVSLVRSCQFSQFMSDMEVQSDHARHDRLYQICQFSQTCQFNQIMPDMSDMPVQSDDARSCQICQFNQTMPDMSFQSDHARYVSSTRPCQTCHFSQIMPDMSVCQFSQIMPDMSFQSDHARYVPDSSDQIISQIMPDMSFQSDHASQSPIDTRSFTNYHRHTRKIADWQTKNEENESYDNAEFILDAMGRKRLAQRGILLELYLSL
ncbi:hypothetical protein ANN_25732 [Periplaneta americana]|uniref:Uncharacterized protein n=1 Tax=Periplaneta americana TaxID=6978 RepID=A0ABQ8S3Z1_PERAM|nr:hypothetical protein ANN_25732 [Periplaneta americana]